MKFPLGGRFKRARSRQPDPGQLSLFPAQILALPVLNPYEQAVRFDEAGESAKARALYLKAIGTDTNAADAHCNLGILESKEGRTVDALECFARALAVNPEHADYPALLAEALDVLAVQAMDIKAAAAVLGVSTSQLIKLIKLEPHALASVNRQRKELGVHALH